MTSVTGALRETLRSFMIICPRILLKMRNVSHKNSRENENTHIMFINFFPRKYAVYEIMWKNMVELNRQKVKI